MGSMAAMTTDQPAGSEPSVPEASFLNFLNGLAQQALLQMGEIPNPMTGERTTNVAFARYSVDLLCILRDRSEGNRTPDEDRYLAAVIPDLQQRLSRIQTSG